MRLSATDRVVELTEFQARWASNGFMTNLIWGGDARVGRRDLLDGDSYYGFGLAQTNGAFVTSGTTVTFTQAGTEMRVVVSNPSQSSECEFRVFPAADGGWTNFELQRATGSLWPALQFRVLNPSGGPTLGGLYGVQQSFGQIWDGGTVAVGWVTSDHRIKFAQQGGYGALFPTNLLSDRLAAGPKRKVSLYCCAAGTALGRVRRILLDEYGVVTQNMMTDSLLSDGVLFLIEYHTSMGGTLTWNQATVDSIYALCQRYDAYQVMLFSQSWFDGRRIVAGAEQAADLLRKRGVDVIAHCFAASWLQKAYAAESALYGSEQVRAYNYGGSSVDTYRYKHEYDGIGSRTQLEKDRLGHVVEAITRLGARKIYWDENDGEDRDDSLVHATTYEWMFGMDRHVRVRQMMGQNIAIMGASGEHGLAPYLEAACGAFDYHSDPHADVVDAILTEYAQNGQFTRDGIDLGWAQASRMSQADVQLMADTCADYSNAFWNIQGSLAELTALANTRDLTPLHMRRMPSHRSRRRVRGRPR